jgi:hypothetical protein
MDTTAVHRHSSRFHQKRLVMYALIVAAVLALAVAAFTGSVPLGVAGAVAVAGALALGMSLACDDGCTPR